MQITLADAIKQLRDDLREAVLEGQGQDIVFTPRGVELELAITFGTELKAGGGFKLLAFLDLSAEAKSSDSSQHKIKLTLDIADKDGKPLKVSSAEQPRRIR
jgi:hypothetical protein